MRVRAIIVLGVLLIALGAVYTFSSRPRPAPEPQPRHYVWSVEMDQLRNMVLALPREGRRKAWVVHQDKYWYFDEPNGPRVDMKRWGGGIPLLLSGPGAERTIATAATDEQLRVYGLTDPRMRIHLVLKDERTIDAEVGDATPAGGACYTRLVGSRDVYAVDATWYEVLERLVLDPPYPPRE